MGGEGGCFSRGELGLNSVKCLVKHINETFDFSLLFLSFFLHSPDGGQTPRAPQPPPAADGQEEDRLAGHQLRGQTGGFFSGPPLCRKGTLTFELYLFNVSLSDLVFSSLSPVLLRGG